MRMSALEQPPTDNAATPEEIDLNEARKRLRASRTDRKRFEPLWEECLAFAAGKMWLERSKVDRRRLYLPDLPKGKVRYTVDEISKFRETILGELSQDDDLPQLLFRQEDQQTEDFADQANDLIGYGWESEWNSDEIVEDAKTYMIDLGTSAIRSWWDPTAGKVEQRVPLGADGKADLSDDTHASLKAGGTMPDGSLPRFKAVHEGATKWEAGSALNLLVPPGIKRERDFPWEGWMAAVSLTKLKELYPGKTIKADALADVEQLSSREVGSLDAPSEGGGDRGKLADHALVFWYYERPTAQHSKGRVHVFAGENMVHLETRPELPRKACDGSYRSGIHYFHYLRLTNRFWSRGMVERGMSGNKIINETRSIMVEHVRRGGPKVYMAKGTVEKMPTGATLEVVWTDPTKPKPIIDQGTPLGQWYFQQVEATREDLARSVGINDVSVGENPANVGTYSQLALLREQDMRGLDPVAKRIKVGVAGLVEDSLYDIHRYWPKKKRFALAGPDGQLRAHEFDKQQWPDLYMVTFPKGAAKPRSQAAQLKMVDDIAGYANASRQPLPVDWVKRSYEAGKPVDLPEVGRDDQAEKARYENGELADGVDPGVDYFDDHAGHVTEHRGLQIQAKLAGRMDVYELVEQHIQTHLAAAAQAQQAAAMQQPALPVPAAAMQQQPPVPPVQ